MKIIWRDTDLKQHEIDLTNAVDVKINGMAISINDTNGIRVNGENPLVVYPRAVNSLQIKEY